MTPARARHLLAAILVAALALRLVFAAYVVGLHTEPKADEADYQAIAAHLAAGDGFMSFEGKATARRPPAYPFFLAALSAVGGPSPVAARIAQVVLGGLVVLLTWMLARHWFGEGAALIAAGLAALNPFLIFISGYLLTENLYLVLLLGALVLVPTPARLAHASWRRTIAVGVLLGLAALSRPSGMPMLEWIVAATFLVGGGAWRQRAARCAVVVAAFAVVVMPWCARNARAVGGWVMTTHGGITFYQGNNHKVSDIAHWRGGAAPMESLPRFHELVRLPELERDELAWKMGKAFVRSQWREMPRLVAWKLARFWRLKSDMGLSGIRSGWWFSRDSTLGQIAADVDVGLVYAVVVIPLFIVGLLVTGRRWRALAFGYGIVLVHTAIAVVFFGSLRGRIPVEPVMCAFAAAALAALTARRRRA